MRMGLTNTSLHENERRMGGRYVERHGLVTSYDPEKYLAKVTFQPEGQESGWLPIETGHIGNGFGIAIGLTTGSGSTNSGGGNSGGGNSSGSQGGGQQQSQGDQVIVRYQEGDIESGKIVQRVHSDKDKPPKVESGEMVFWHEKGAKIFFKKDGSLTVEGPKQSDGSKSASVIFDKDGNINNVAKNKTDKYSKDHTVAIDGDKDVTIKGKRTDKISKVWKAVAQFGNWDWLVSGSDNSD